MTTLPVGYFQVNLQFTGSAAPSGAEVVFGAKNDALLDVATVANLFQTNWDTNLKSKTNSLLTLDRIRVKAGPQATGVFIERAVGVAGTQVSAPVSPQVSMMLVKNSLTGGRHGRGRTFWPGLPEAHVDPSGLIGSVDIAAYNTAFAAFLAQMNTDQLPMVILHNDGAVTPTIVTSWQVSSKVATQRDRLRRR